MATFVHQTQGTHDPETGLFSGVTATEYEGEAVQVSGGADEFVRFRDLGVSQEQAVVLGWSPDLYQQASLPPIGSTIAWGPDTLTLVAVLKTVAPDAVPIYARLGCRR